MMQAALEGICLILWGLHPPPPPKPWGLVCQSRNPELIQVLLQTMAKN